MMEPHSHKEEEQQQETFVMDTFPFCGLFSADCLYFKCIQLRKKIKAHRICTQRKA